MFTRVPSAIEPEVESWTVASLTDASLECGDVNVLPTCGPTRW